MGERRHVRQYPPELRERAIRLVVESKGDYATEWEAIKSVAGKFGIGSSETLRKWIRTAEGGGAGSGAGAEGVASSKESAQVKALKAEVRELRRANEILRAAAGFFAAELDRPPRSW